ncbi:hypothetical protein Tco_0667259 [Tanacetum coccineum]
MIEPTVALFRVFQTLCKQGDWFSFSKRRAPSPVCIDDNQSCMKHWKSGFFFIDRMAILDFMVWRHPSAAIDDLRLVAGSYSLADVRRLSAHVIKLRDMPEGVLVLSVLSRVWKSRVCDPVLQGADKNVMGIHDFLCLPEWTGVEVQEEPHLDDLAVGTPSSKILAKAEASYKRKAFTSGATLSHVTKRTRSALAQSSGSTIRPSLFVGDSDDESDGDDDACVKIPLVTPLCSAAMIFSLGNQGGSFAAEGSNGRDSRGNDIMVDDTAASYFGVSRPRPSSRPAPLFRDVSGDATHADFFPFLLVLIMPFNPKVMLLGIASLLVRSGDAPYLPTFGFPTPGEMVRVESLSDDQLTAKMSVLHCMMMSHCGELLARYRGLNQSHHEYVLSSNSRLKGYEEKVASLTGLELQVSTLKKQVSGLNEKLSSFDASFAKLKSKGNERNKKIKSLTKSLDNLHTEGLIRTFLVFDEFSRVQGELLSLAASVRFERRLSMHRTKDEFDVMLKKMANFMHGAQDRLAEASPLDARVSPPTTRESTVKPASKSLELSTNADLTLSVVASEHNEEMVNAEVDVSDPKMTDDTVVAKSGHAFVQGIFVALEDAVELVEVGSGRASSGPNDVVVALSAGEKGDGLVPSSVAGEEAAVNPSGV